MRASTKFLMIYIIILTVTFTIVSAQSEIRYNFLEDHYIFSEIDDDLRYNYIEDRYEFSGSDDQLRYNVIEDEYEYARSTDQLRFNFFDNKYEFAPADAYLMYNYIDNIHGFSHLKLKSGEEIQDIILDDYTIYTDPILEYVDP